MSVIGDGIRSMDWGTRAKKPRSGGPTPRGGLMDLLLVLVAVYAALSRTPVGALMWYGEERLRGHDSDLPSLTEYFSTGAIAPPDDLVVAPPVPGGIADDQLPEPWRTAARTTLSQQVPDALSAALEARGVSVTPDAALTELDALYKLHRDPALALEIAAVGADQRQRAVDRATAAGEADPESYEVHRRYLPGSAALAGDRFVGGTLALATALDLSWPLNVPFSLTSPFGDRIHPILGEKKFHEGVDLAVPVGTTVLAAQNGTIAVVGKNSVSGNYVVIDHGYGVRTAYCHLSSAPVQQGAKISKSEPFALSGNTGRSTGPHLHFGVTIAGKWVDPERFRR